MIDRGQHLRREICIPVVAIEPFNVRDRTGIDGFFDLIAHFCRKPLLGHRSEVGRLFQRISQLQVLGELDGPVDEVVEARGMHVNSLNSAAALPRIERRAIHKPFRRCADICVFRDVARILASKLQAQRSECACGGLFDHPARLYRPGEINKSERSRRDQVQRRGMVEEQVLEHIIGQPCFLECGLHAFADKHRLRRVLQNHGTACNEGRRDRVDRGHVGVVPRRNHEHGREWLP